MATTSTRVFIDCSEMPSESGCTLYIAGKPDEVLKAAVAHAISAHGHKDSPELIAMIQSGLKPEAA
jgi:hypothetical protein